MRSLIHSPVIIAALIILVSFIAFTLGTRQSTSIAFINMKSAISIPAKLITEEVPKTKQASVMAAYTKALPKVIKAYGQTHHLSIVSGVTLADQGVDVTDAIIENTLSTVEQRHV